MESNAHWGELAQEYKDLWDHYKSLPEAGVNEALDVFCEKRQITIESLVRVGARLSETFVIAYAYPDGIKYRDLIATERTWTREGVEWHKLKIIKARQPTTGIPTAIVAEGETDAARLSDLFPGFDIAVMPGGARYWPNSFTEQLRDYERVLVALDNDDAGNDGASKILKALPINAVRYLPPANDWCSSKEIDIPPVPAPKQPMESIVWGDDLFSIETPQIASWFDRAILPVGGLLMFHGPTKSFKSWMALDMALALATSEPWCGFEAMDEPARVCIVQFEVQSSYYQERWRKLRERTSAELFCNVGHWEPWHMARLIAGDTALEDAMLEKMLRGNVQIAFFDPIRRMMGLGDMNSEKDVRRPLAFFERLMHEGITVVACHHDNKSRHGEIYAMTGSAAFAGDADTIVTIYKPRGHSDESRQRNMKFTLRNGPTPGGRGFEILPDGDTTYRNELWDGEAEYADVDAPPL